MKKINISNYTLEASGTLLVNKARCYNINEQPTKTCELTGLENVACETLKKDLEMIYDDRTFIFYKSNHDIILKSYHDDDTKSFYLVDFEKNQQYLEASEELAYIEYNDVD